MKTDYAIAFAFTPNTSDPMTAVAATIALGDDPQISVTATTLKTSLENETNKVLSKLEWKAGYPTTPEELREYSQLITRGLTPQILDLVEKAIEPVLAKEDIPSKFNSNLAADSGSDLAENLKKGPLSQFELRALAPQVCIPVGDRHVCTTIVHTRVPSQEFIVAMQSDTRGEFEYKIIFEIEFLRVES